MTNYNQFRGRHQGVELDMNEKITKIKQNIRKICECNCILKKELFIVIDINY